MKIFKNIIIFGIIPILIIGLLYINGSLQAQKYEEKTVDLKQYGAKIITEVDHQKVSNNTEIIIPVTIKNVGTMAWLHTNKNINLSYHIMSEEKKVIVKDGLRTNLTSSVKSDDSIKLNAVVETPLQSGIYYVEFDMVHEGVTWFKDKGSETTTVKLEVE